MKETKRYVKIILLVYSKNYFMGEIGQFVPTLDLTMVCWKVEVRTSATIVHVNSFPQTRELSIPGKLPAFKEEWKFYILGGGLQPPGDWFFKGIAGSTADLQIIFLKPSDKMCADILLTVCHNRSLYLLFFLYQHIFPVVLQEL